MSQLADAFTSYSRLVNLMAQNVDHILGRHNVALQSLTEITSQLTNSVLRTNSANAACHHINILHTRLQADLTAITKEWLLSFLITKNDFLKAIDYIEVNLTQQYIPLHLVRKRYEEVMQLSQFSVTRLPDNVLQPALILTVKFPLALNDRPMKLYKVYNLLHSADSSDLHVTKLISLPQYIS